MNWLTSQSLAIMMLTLWKEHKSYKCINSKLKTKFHHSLFKLTVAWRTYFLSPPRVRPHTAELHNELLGVSRACFHPRVGWFVQIYVAQTGVFQTYSLCNWSQRVSHSEYTLKATEERRPLTHTHTPPRGGETRSPPCLSIRVQITHSHTIWGKLLLSPGRALQEFTWNRKWWCQRWKVARGYHEVTSPDPCPHPRGGPPIRCHLLSTTDLYPVHSSLSTPTSSWHFFYSKHLKKKGGGSLSSSLRFR